MRDKIIALAKEAGIDPNWIRKVPELPDFLERFYQLAVAEEREECAKVCDSYSTEPFDWAVYCEMLYQTLAQIGEK